MKKIKYIVRDFRGTIMQLDTKKYGHVKQIADIYNQPKKDIRKAVSEPLSKFRRGEISETIFWKKVAYNLQSPLKKDCKKVFHTPISNYSKPYKSLLNLISKLKILGYKNIILSDDFKPALKQIQKSGIRDYFDGIIISCQIGLSKFDDATNGTDKIRKYVFRKYNTNAREVVFIDDNQNNWTAAKAIGIKSILAKKPLQTAKDLKKLLKTH